MGILLDELHVERTPKRFDDQFCPVDVRSGDDYAVVVLRLALSMSCRLPAAVQVLILTRESGWSSIEVTDDLFHKNFLG